MIQRELKSRKKGRSIDEIKDSVEILASCTMKLYREGKVVWTGTVLQDLTSVTREDYNNGDRLHAARLPLIVSKTIKSKLYRQINYDRLLTLKKPLSRWILKKLVTKYTYAEVDSKYHFMFNDLLNSGLLNSGTEARKRTEVRSCLDELKRTGAILSWKDDNKLDGQGLIHDVKYTVEATSVFSDEQEIANGHLKLINGFSGGRK